MLEPSPDTDPKLQFPSSIFHIDREHVPALLNATSVSRMEQIAEQLAGPDYALHLLVAVEAVQELAAVWSEAALHWSPPLAIDLQQCSIDCAESHIPSDPPARHLRFWFYSEDLIDWMEGYSERFFDFGVTIDADSLAVVHLSGPSR